MDFASDNDPDCVADNSCDALLACSTQQDPQQHTEPHGTERSTSDVKEQQGLASSERCRALQEAEGSSVTSSSLHRNGQRSSMSCTDSCCSSEFTDTIDESDADSSVTGQSRSSQESGLIRLHAKGLARSVFASRAGHAVRRKGQAKHSALQTRPSEQPQGKPAQKAVERLGDRKLTQSNFLGVADTIMDDAVILPGVQQGSPSGDQNAGETHPFD